MIDNKPPITSYDTFKYVKKELQQDIAESEENIKQMFASKIPFGLGKTLFNKNLSNQELTNAIKKEAFNSSIPLVKRFFAKALKKNKKKILIWGITGISALILGNFLERKS